MSTVERNVLGLTALAGSYDQLPGSARRRVDGLLASIAGDLAALGVSDLTQAGDRLKELGAKDPAADALVAKITQLRRILEGGPFLDASRLEVTNILEMPTGVQSAYGMPSGDLAVELRYSPILQLRPEVVVTNPHGNAFRRTTRDAREKHYSNRLFGVSADNRVMLLKHQNNSLSIQIWDPYAGESALHRVDGDSVSFAYNRDRNEVYLLKSNNSIPELEICDVAQGVWRPVRLPANFEYSPIEGITDDGKLVHYVGVYGGFALEDLSQQAALVIPAPKDDTVVLPNGHAVIRTKDPKTGVDLIHYFKKSRWILPIPIGSKVFAALSLSAFTEEKGGIVLIADYTEGEGRIRAIDIEGQSIIAEIPFSGDPDARPILDITRDGELLVASGNLITMIGEGKGDFR